MRSERWVTNFALLAGSTVWLTAVLIMPSRGAQSPPKVNFSRDVLPILSDKCFKCHGPDSSGRQVGLRLDVAEGAFANRGGKFPIVPGKPDHSMVVNRINSHDYPMPPPYSGKSLSKNEIAILTRWISEGARYDRLWSFEPIPISVPVPTTASSWPKNNIDRFVLARLKQERLSPTPPASKARLLRRVTLDLTGLPPTEQEIKSFTSDTRSDAFERVVDRLLASPHFGERVAVDWLDAARYSDSYGYQSDLLSPTWPYRDWVVKAFNKNMPYNEFLAEQIAGDLMPAATRDQKLATAFNRLHRQSNEGGSIALEFKTTYANDRVDTFGTAVLGLTVGCARCHDHKFDPITQREYYQLFAYFNSIDEYGLLLSTEIVPTPSMLLPTPAQEARLKALKGADINAQKALSDTKTNSGARFEGWLAGKQSEPKIPDTIAHFTLDSEAAGKFSSDLGGKAFGEKLGSVDLVSGHQGKAVQFDGDNGLAIRGLPGRERWDAFTWSLWVNDVKRSPNQVVVLHRTGGTDVGFCGFDLLLEDGYLTARVMRAWPGNAIAVRSNQRIAKGTWTHVGWSWDGSGRVDGLKLYMGGHRAPTSVLADTIWKRIDAYGDLGGGGGDWTFAQRFRDAGFRDGRLDDVTFVSRAISDVEMAQLANGASLVEAMKSPSDHGAELRGYFLSAVDSETRRAQQAVQSAQTALALYEEGVYEIPVMKESRTPIPAYVLARGNYDAPRNDKTRVVRDVPRALPPLRQVGSNDRLALARWVTRSDHPLTARVAANRLWQMVFGIGLVETSENFGVQGSRASHPQLLNYLARKFISSGWDVKALLREMVLSATYRQDSGRSLKNKNLDPDNRLLARGPSRRLSAEMIRDTVLRAAGLLNPKIGGTPVNPYQPAGIWQENNTMSPGFIQSKGDDLYRRSLYSTWKRTTPVPSMLLFDATSREACAIRRPNTNTPLQALVLLNDVQFVEAARVLAELVMNRGGDATIQIRLGFKRLSGREPDTQELDVLLESLKDQMTQFNAAPGDAVRLIRMGDSKADPRLKPIELAAMTIVMQEIINSDAVVWKR